VWDLSSSCWYGVYPYVEKQKDSPNTLGSTNKSTTPTNEKVFM
jgi:hypothetical protein